MPSAATIRRKKRGIEVNAVLGLLLASVLLTSRGRAEQESVPPRLEIRGDVAARPPFAPRGASSKRTGAKRPESSSTWWLGTGGIALALAAVGGLSVASKRFLPPRSGANALRVLGRTSLSPKHSVYLLEVGQRILIIGTGAQGAPSLLGELTDPAECEAFLGTPRRVDSNVSVSIRPSAAPGRFDRRVGDDE